MGLPLDKVMVIDMTRNISGPYCSMMLGDMGAEVIKVEHPDGGDELRTLYRYPGRADHDEDYFCQFNRNKRSWALNLKDPRDRDRLIALVRKSDVFLENLAPGAADRLGLSWPILHDENPALVYASISGFGKSVGGVNSPAYDAVVEAASGLMARMGDPNGPPVRCAVPLADMASGMFTAFAVVCALRGRELTGHGEYIDVAMYDSVLALQAPLAAEWFATGSLGPRMGNEVAHRAPQGAFATADNRHIIVVTNERSWLGLCAALNLVIADKQEFATNADRVRNRKALNAAIAAAMRQMTAVECRERLGRHGVPHAQVVDLDEALVDPLTHARSMVIDCQRGEKRISLMGFPYKMENTPCYVRRAPPSLGEANDDLINVLQEDLKPALREGASTSSSWSELKERDGKHAIDGAEAY